MDNKNLKAAIEWNDNEQEKINIRFVELMSSKHGARWENHLDTDSHRSLFKKAILQVKRINGVIAEWKQK